MKIILRNDELKFPIKLFLPLGSLRFIYNLLMKYSPGNFERVKLDRKFIKAIKKYIHENGHFVLVDVKSEDSSVIIKV